MGRPERHDVDYFPFFVKRGRTLNILQKKYGLEGIGFFTNLLRFLSSTPDHHYCIKDETDKLNFFAEIGIDDEERGIAMIDLMVKTAKFDKCLWEDHKVVASEAFLESLEEAYRKRSNKIITIGEIRAKFEKGGINPVSGAVNPVNSAVNPAENDPDGVSSPNNPQSKVKKSKVKKSKVNSTAPKRIALLDREPKNDLERVNKKWLENYIALFGSQPINPRWDLTSSLVKNAIDQAGIEKVLQALDTAMKDKFCFEESGYTLKVIMSGNVISRLINRSHGSVTPKGLSEKISLSELD